MKKHPDNIVFDYKSQTYNANVTNFPTSIGAPKFDVLEIDMSSSVEAKNYFSSKFKEIKLEYERLIDCYNWTKIIYDSEYSFQPITGHNYHLYKRNDNTFFLSIIEPDQWRKKYIGTFCLLTNGSWMKITDIEK